MKVVAIQRAIELLGLVSAFVEQNNLEACDLTYDEADCDGQCFAEDCASAAEALEQALNTMKEPT